MRQARLKVPSDRRVGYYHCFSRVVDRRAIFGTVEKEQFVVFLREYEAFCQVQVLTYSVMPNHFHILLEVPKRPEQLPTMEVVLGWLEQLTGEQDLGAVRQELDRCRREGDAAGEARLLARYLARMWDVSAFMKLVKQRFTQWYNARQGRKGTLWEERFGSVLVEGAGQTLTTMAAYIDLNAVRGGLVGDAKEYRWCGYGAAMGGVKRARQGLGKVVEVLLGEGTGRKEGKEGKEAMDVYRMHLYQEGREERETVLESGRTRRQGISREEVVKVMRGKGRIGVAEYVRCRVRYFCDGAVLGTKAYVEEIFLANRARFGARRKSGARRMKGLKEELYALRDLRVNLFG